MQLPSVKDIILGDSEIAKDYGTGKETFMCNLGQLHFKF
jgi:hypothetical protein